VVKHKCADCPYSYLDKSTNYYGDIVITARCRLDPRAINAYGCDDIYEQAKEKVGVK